MFFCCCEECAFSTALTEEAAVNMPEQSNDYRVVVFGAGGVGKSSLVLRFIKGTFRESYIPTIEDTYRQVRVICLRVYGKLEIFII